MAYRVLVAVADTTQVEQLVRTARDLADTRDGDVFVTTVVTKPPNSPFSVFSNDVIRREYSGDAREILDRAVETAADRGVEVDGRLVVAKSVAGGLFDAVTEFEADALVMGWHGRERRDVVMGHVVDRVVAGAPCDVLVEKVGTTADGVETVLLPADDGPHGALAGEVATAVARAHDARVDVVRVVPPDASEAERDDARALADRVAASLDWVDTEVRVREGDTVEALVGAAEAHDVTAIAGGGDAWLRRLRVPSTAREVGRRADATVVVATRGPATGLQAWLTRLGA